MLRTIYPSLATEQSCVDCHNQLQAGRQQWHLNDVMGAFAIDIPIGGFLEDIKAEVTPSGFAFSRRWPDWDWPFRFFISAN